MARGQLQKQPHQHRHDRHRRDEDGQYHQLETPPARERACADALGFIVVSSAGHLWLTACIGGNRLYIDMMSGSFNRPVPKESKRERDL